MSCSSGKNEEDIEIFSDLEDMQRYLENKVTKGIEQLRLRNAIDELTTAINNLSLSILASTDNEREFIRRRLKK